jgi:hypothetical protein
MGCFQKAQWVSLDGRILSAQQLNPVTFKTPSTPGVYILMLTRHSSLDVFQHKLPLVVLP